MADDTTARDLDETRRLLYTALLDGRTKRSELAGTLVNALAHHGLDVDPGEAERMVVAALNADPGLDGAAWLRGQIADITARLTDADPLA